MGFHGCIRMAAAHWPAQILPTTSPIAQTLPFSASTDLTETLLRAVPTNNYGKPHGVLRGNLS